MLARLMRLRSLALVIWTTVLCLGWSAAGWAAGSHLEAWAYVRDATGQMSLDEVQKQPLTPFDGYLSRFFAGDVFWVRLRIVPDEGRSIAASHAPALLALRANGTWGDEVTLYDPSLSNAPALPLDRGNWSAVRANQAWRFSIPYTAAPREVWLRLHSTGPLLFGFSLLSAEAANESERQEHFSAGVIFGMLVAFLILSVAAVWADNALLTRVWMFRQLCNTGVMLVNSSSLTPWLTEQAAHASLLAWGANALRFVNPIASMWYCLVIITLFSAPPLAQRMLKAHIGCSCVAALLFVLGYLDVARNLLVLLVLVGFVLMPVAALLLPIPRPVSQSRAARLQAVARWLGLALMLPFAWLASFPGGNVFRYEPYSLSVLLAIAAIASGVLLVATWQRLGEVRAQRQADRRQAELTAQALTMERGERERQQEFMMMLTHELKAPLSTLGLVFGTPNASPQMQGHARNALEAMGRVIDHCAQAVRLDDPDVPLVPRACALLAEVRQLQDGATEPARIEIVGGADLPSILVDPRVLAVIVNNLLENALRYSPAGSRVVLELSREAGVCQRVRVRNELFNNDAPDPQLLFQKYYRSEAARRVSGTGLGLHLSRLLARRLGGELSYEAGPEQAVFVLRLPE